MRLEEGKYYIEKRDIYDMFLCFLRLQSLEVKYIKHIIDNIDGCSRFISEDDFGRIQYSIDSMEKQQRLFRDMFMFADGGKYV